MKKTEYTISSPRLDRTVRLAVVADLHGNPPMEVLSLLQSDPPDLIAAPGDIGERLDGSNRFATENMLRFFGEAQKIAPVYFSFGNHELGACGHIRVSEKSLRTCGMRIVNPEILAQMKQTGIHVLDDGFVDRGKLRIGGLTTGMIHRGNVPNTGWLKNFCAGDQFRILLCHHPEYYEPYLRELPIDLILSGHAHGGHWRLFGRGAYAPGQGLFPQYTSGVTDGRFVISRGTGDHTPIPRLFNPHEVVYVTLQKDETPSDMAERKKDI